MKQGQATTSRASALLVPGMTRELVPLEDWVLLQQPEPPPGGYLIEAPTPDALVASLGAVVRAVGPGRYSEQGVLIPTRVKPGMHVWPEAGVRLSVVPGRSDMWLIRERFLMCQVVDDVPLISVPGAAS